MILSLKPKPIFRIVFLISAISILSINVQAQTEAENNGSDDQRPYFDRSTGDKELSFIKTFVWSFTKYIEWPESESQKFKIGLIQDTVLIPYLESLKVDYDSVKDQEIEIVRLNGIENCHEMDILIVPPACSFSEAAINAAIEGHPVFLVTENWQQGKSMINFVMIENKLKFEITKDRIFESNLNPSHVLLELGINVENRE